MTKKNNFNKRNTNNRSNCGNYNTINIPHKQLRSHCVSVRLNNEELTLLNEKRGHHRKGEWLRLSLLNTIPGVFLAINIEAWRSLADLSQKLNKIVPTLIIKALEAT